MKYSLALALILGAVANEFDLDDPEWCPCEAEADTDDDIIREEFNGHSDLDQQHKKALLRLLVKPAMRIAMSTPLQSEMLRLFQTGAASYQPDGISDGLAAETGDPKVAAANIRRLLASGRMIIDALIRPTGTLFMFSTGEQYYTPALRLGQDGLPTALLAEIANEAGYGDLEELLENYTAMSADFEGHLPDFRPDPRLDADLQAAPKSAPSNGNRPAKMV